MRQLLSGLVVASISLSACTGGGPSAYAIINSDVATTVVNEQDEPFVLVDLNQSFAESVSGTIPKLQSSLPQVAQEPFVIGIGDTLSIAIITNSEDGFLDFSQSSINPIATTQLPDQVVASDGSVSIPPLGRVRADGKTVQSLETLLNRRLGDVLINPTATVQLVDRQSATVSVIGTVAQPGSYPINLSDRHVLDIIGAAGGPTAQAKDLVLSLNRRGKKSTARLSDVYEKASLNVHVRNGDLISIEPNLLRVRMLGGTAANDLLEFVQFEVNLIDVLSDAGGILNRRALREGVFVYRNAPTEQLASIGTDLTNFMGERHVPTVFRLDLTEPTSLFTGQKFQMMDGDIVYVADNLNEALDAFFNTSSNVAPLPAEFIRDDVFGNNGIN